MKKFKSEFLEVMSQRGFISDCTDYDALDELLAANHPVAAYIGFDCTAPSLHVGNLMQAMTLRWLQKTGHKPIVLMGGATTKVGDPSGKDESRKMLSEADIQVNMESIKTVFSRFLDFDNSNPNHAIMVNNEEWLGEFGYIDFLRDIGPHFSVNRMLSMESVKLRIEREQELSFLEFSYMILQAFDFVELARNYDCRLQIGGSDQWGNIVNGVELGRRLAARDTEEGKKIGKLFGLTTPLITTSSGAKMGKTAQGAMWLNPDMLSPYDYWQFWRNTEDADVGRFMRFFTELPLDEIARLEKLEGAEINQAKIILANEATRLCHGEDAAKTAEETARKVFTEGSLGDDLPVVKIERARLEEGIAAFALFREAGLAESGGMARKLIRGGGAKVNDVKIADENQQITTSDLTSDNIIKLSAGKKRHIIVKT